MELDRDHSLPSPFRLSSRHRVLTGRKSSKRRVGSSVRTAEASKKSFMRNSRLRTNSRPQSRQRRSNTDHAAVQVLAVELLASLTELVPARNVLRHLVSIPLVLQSHALRPRTEKRRRKSPHR